MNGVTSRPQATARRKPASERLAEIIETAAAIAVAEGLDRVTAKRVAAELGVFPGLVSHYDPAEPALQILSLIDGLSVQAATRQTLDYAPVRAMVTATTERLLAIAPGTLAPKNF